MGDDLERPREPLTGPDFRPLPRSSCSGSSRLLFVSPLCKTMNSFVCFVYISYLCAPYLFGIFLKKNQAAKDFFKHFAVFCFCSCILGDGSKVCKERTHSLYVCVVSGRGARISSGKVQNQRPPGCCGGIRLDRNGFCACGCGRCFCRWDVGEASLVL